jgi:N-acetylmuramoyl-L-alanine amidase
VRGLPLFLVTSILITAAPAAEGEVIEGEVVFEPTPSAEAPDLAVFNEGAATVVEVELAGIQGIVLRRSGSTLVLDLPADESPGVIRTFPGAGFVDEVVLRPHPRETGYQLRALLWPGEYLYRAERSGDTIRLEVRDAYGKAPEALKPDANFDRLRIRRVVIDPGHGGDYTGTGGFCGRYLEKTLVLPISFYLANLLERNLGLEVILTRTADTKIGLHGRTVMANTAQADLFISIHLNGHSNTAAHGAETFFLADALTSDDRALAHLENADFELDPDLPMKTSDELSFILGDLMQSEYLEESQSLASCVQQKLVYNLGCNDRGVKQANFYVLRGTQMPAILVEVGFLTNESEEARLADPSYEYEAAYAIYRGIAEFKEEFERGLME